MLNAFYNKLTKKQQHEIMLNTFSRSLIIWKPAIKTWAQEMNGGPGNEQGSRSESWTVPPPSKLYFHPWLRPILKDLGFI